MTRSRWNVSCAVVIACFGQPPLRANWNSIMTEPVLTRLRGLIFSKLYISWALIVESLTSKFDNVVRFIDMCKHVTLFLFFSSVVYCKGLCEIVPLRRLKHLNSQSRIAWSVFMITVCISCVLWYSTPCQSRRINVDHDLSWITSRSLLHYSRQTTLPVGRGLGAKWS